MGGSGCLLLLSACLAAGQAPWPVTAWWSFDEEAGDVVRDSGPHGLDGTLGGAVARAPGMHGGGLAFEAGQPGWVSLPRTPALDLEPPFTIAAWIRPGAGSSTMEIVSKKHDTAEAGYRFRFFYRMLDFHWGDGQQRHSVTSPRFSVPVGHWCHVAVAHDGQRVVLFVNAAEVAAVDDPARPAAEPAAAVLANYLGRKDAYPFVGRLDEVVLLAAALEGDEVFRLASGR